MKPQKWLGAALATAVAGALALGVQGPSYTSEPDKQRSDRSTQVEKVGATKRQAIAAAERSYRGLPVYGGDVVVAVDSQGRAVGSTSGQKREISVATTPTVSKAAARATAKRQLAKVRSVSRPTLEVYADGAPRLAWRT